VAAVVTTPVIHLTTATMTPILTGEDGTYITTIIDRTDQITGRIDRTNQTDQMTGHKSHIPLHREAADRQAWGGHLPDRAWGGLCSDLPDPRVVEVVSVVAEAVGVKAGSNRVGMTCKTMPHISTLYRDRTV
jgi:hypothetical protein